MSDEIIRDDRPDRDTSDNLPTDAADPHQPAARRRQQIGSAGGGPYAAGRPEDQHPDRPDEDEPARSSPADREQTFRS
ncbi:hypothetical protein [Actinoplanes friuliensis]|uniref:Uncharacterized protein n=1 Tax=Actinoplanes friuliensis DSM 7358 TaxID=1246995 RepID=U5VZH6_9ACTN|nr:hypothetical protein [Actinoplanes friuliensis]AGZ41110.1 hypothetical protein AFR_14140 [Actinoplanes friuliensis DSM 7358]